jgi:multisubunit Na+/H+ antiporter MnhE subunit
VFSFAIVLWEILTGEEPYANMHYGAIIGIVSVLLFFCLCMHVCVTKNASGHLLKYKFEFSLSSHMDLFSLHECTYTICIYTRK